MDTTLRPYDVDELPAVQRPDVAAYFETIRTAQEDFLITAGKAQAMLDRDSGQLAHVAAIHGRMTRRFFDAQRSILSLRAKVDDDVALIGVSEGGDSARLTPWVDVVLADLNGAAAEHQLTSMLDEWWRTENEEARALIDDAHARAAIARHVADVAAVADERPSQLPSAMVSALDTADPAGLRSLLSSLANSLELMPADVTRSLALTPSRVPTKIGPSVFDLPPATPLVSELAPQDSFRQFWTTDIATQAPERSPRWIATQVLLPMAVVMSVIALIFALVG
jgi:hypothetical protein